MKPREFVPAVIKLYYKARCDISDWLLDQSLSSPLHTKFLLDRKLVDKLRIKLRDVYLRYLDSNLNRSDGNLDKHIKEYKKALNKVLAQLN